MIAALAGDPERFLQRNASIQWGIMVCVYGLSYVPALMALDFLVSRNAAPSLVFFLVSVVQVALLVQRWSHGATRSPVAERISRSFFPGAPPLNGAGFAAILGLFMYWMTPFKPGQALVMAFLASFSGLVGHFVMKALKRDAGSLLSGKVTVTGAVGLLSTRSRHCASRRPCSSTRFAGTSSSIRRSEAGSAGLSRPWPISLTPLSSMRILGIDPGLATTGFGVIDVEGSHLQYVASGTIRTDKMALGDLPGRIKVLFDGIREVSARYQPDRRRSRSCSST